MVFSVVYMYIVMYTVSGILSDISCVHYGYVYFSDIMYSADDIFSLWAWVLRNSLVHRMCSVTVTVLIPVFLC